MHSPIGTATKDEQRRWLRFRDIGCIACHKLGFRGVPADVHHLLSGGRRISHSDTIPLCPYHHRGNLPDALTITQTVTLLGPSLALSSRLFRQKFGSDEELLALTNELVAAAEERAA